MKNTNTGFRKGCFFFHSRFSYMLEKRGWGSGFLVFSICNFTIRCHKILNRSHRQNLINDKKRVKFLTLLIPNPCNNTFVWWSSEPWSILAFDQLTLSYSLMILSSVTLNLFTCRILQPGAFQNYQVIFALVTTCWKCVAMVKQ